MFKKFHIYRLDLSKKIRQGRKGLAFEKPLKKRFLVLNDISLYRFYLSVRKYNSKQLYRLELYISFSFVLLQ